MSDTMIRQFMATKIDRRYVSCAPSTLACPGMVTIADQNLVQIASAMDGTLLRAGRAWMADHLSHFSGPPNMEFRVLFEEELESDVDFFGVVLGIPILDSNGSGNVFVVRRLGFTASPIERDVDMLRRDVHLIFQSLALHEVDEWLRFDGAHVSDPHPNLN